MDNIMALKKWYKVPVSWQMYGYMDIEAEGWDEALEIAEDDGTSLPDGDYVDGSFEVDHDVLEWEKEAERQQIRREADKGFPTGNDADFGTSME